jgi:hypothetical protein
MARAVLSREFWSLPPAFRLASGAVATAAVLLRLFFWMAFCSHRRESLTFAFT